MATFDELLEAVKSAGIPEAGLTPVREKWNEAFNLILQNNKWVAQVNAARAKDPNDVEYIDSLWKTHAKSDPKAKTLEEQFDAVSEEYERLLKELREFGKTRIEEPLSEEQVKETRQKVNAATPAIEEAKSQAAAMVTIIDGVLGALDKGVEGGVITLLPEVESLKNARGRKNATGEKGPYMTRIGKFVVDGTEVDRDGKVNFHIAAEKLSKLLGADKFPENKVTGIQLEEDYFKSLPGSPEFRSIPGTEIPLTHTFDFTREVKLGEGTTETKSFKLTVERKNEKASTATETTEAPKTETPVSETPKVETPKATEVKQEVPAPAKPESAPAKKTTPAPAKK